MTFFNKKEEVIDLVLTRRGRELLSEGSEQSGFFRKSQLKPTYYAFFDDDVIYDSEWTLSGTLESQNSIVSRIKDSIISKNQCHWGITSGSQIKTVFSEKELPHMSMLAKSSPNTDKKPAWQIHALEGVITGSNTNRVKNVPIEYNRTTLEEYTGEKIPQIDIVCDYFIQTINKTASPEIWQQLILATNKDGTKKYNIQSGHDTVMLLKKSSDDILLDIEEKNADNFRNNFKLEVYKYNDWKSDSDLTWSVEEIKKLYFGEDAVSSDFVEYFFTVLADTDAEDGIDIKFINDESLLKKPEDEDDCA